MRFDAIKQPCFLVGQLLAARRDSEHDGLPAEWSKVAQELERLDGTRFQQGREAEGDQEQSSHLR